MIKSKAFNTLGEVLVYWAQVQPDRKAYTMLDSNGVEDSCITYADMYSKAIEIAQALLSYRLQSRNAVLLYPPGIDFIVGFFGCLYAGVPPAPIHPPKHNRSNKRIADLVLSTEASAVLLPTTHQQVFRDALMREENWPKDLIYIPTDTIIDPSLSKSLPLPESDGSMIVSVGI